MKPLNLDNRPCSPISSNCVVWQGPDISCINICHGDTISDVVAALATELCTLLDQTNVNNYDLACLGITGCGPKDFQALVQLLIDKICELQNIDTVETPRQPQGTCPDCIVTIASCFRVGNQTTMQLLDYVNMIAEKVCALIDQINNLQIQINSLDIRVTVLENATPPSFTLPSIETNCLALYMSGSVSATIDLVLDTLLNDPIIGYCSLIDSTGLPSELFSAVSSACLTATSPTLSNPPVPFGTEYLGSWVNSPTTVADTLTNLWLVVCDTYVAFASFAPPTSVVTAGDGITVATTVVGTTTTYEVSANAKPELSVYIAPPEAIEKVAPSLGTGNICGVTAIQICNTIEYNDFGAAYDATTGIFTVPVTGRYTIAFFSTFARETGDGWYDPAVPGMWIVGIVSPTDCNVYCINNFTPVVIQKNASINGSMTHLFGAGTQFCVKALNLTNFKYNSQTGDIVRFSVQRVD